MARADMAPEGDRSVEQASGDAGVDLEPVSGVAARRAENRQLRRTPFPVTDAFIAAMDRGPRPALSAFVKLVTARATSCARSCATGMLIRPSRHRTRPPRPNLGFDEDEVIEDGVTCAGASDQASQ